MFKFQRVCFLRFSRLFFLKLAIHITTIFDFYENAEVLSVNDCICSFSNKRWPYFNLKMIVHGD